MPTTTRVGAFDEEGLAQLNQIIEELSDGIDALELKQTKSAVVKTASVGTVIIRAVETEIRHDLGEVPKVILVATKADATWWLTRDPVLDRFWITASVLVEAYITVQA